MCGETRHHSVEGGRPARCVSDAQGRFRPEEDMGQRACAIIAGRRRWRLIKLASVSSHECREVNTFGDNDRAPRAVRQWAKEKEPTSSE
jgi:hypothetical protein